MRAYLGAHLPLYVLVSPSGRDRHRVPLERHRCCAGDSSVWDWQLSGVTGPAGFR